MPTCERLATRPKQSSASPTSSVSEYICFSQTALIQYSSRRTALAQTLTQCSQCSRLSTTRGCAGEDARRVRILSIQQVAACTEQRETADGARHSSRGRKAERHEARRLRLCERGERESGVWESCRMIAAYPPRQPNFSLARHRRPLAAGPLAALSPPLAWMPRGRQRPERQPR